MITWNTWAEVTCYTLGELFEPIRFTLQSILFGAVVLRVACSSLSWTMPDKIETYLICLWTTLAAVTLFNLCLLAAVLHSCFKVSIRKVSHFTTEDAI